MALKSISLVTVINAALMLLTNNAAVLFSQFQFFWVFSFLLIHLKSLVLIKYFQVLSSSINYYNFLQVSCSMRLFGTSSVLVGYQEDKNFQTKVPKPKAVSLKISWSKTEYHFGKLPGFSKKIMVLFAI